MVMLVLKDCYLRNKYQECYIMGGLCCKRSNSKSSEDDIYGFERTRIAHAFIELDQLIRDFDGTPQAATAVEECVKLNNLCLGNYLTHVNNPVHPFKYPPLVALRSGNRHALDVLNQLGFRFPHPDLKWTEPLLLFFCRIGDFEMVKLLVEDYNFDVNEACGVDTPLSEASYNIDSCIVSYLLEKGASPLVDPSDTPEAHLHSVFTHHLVFNHLVNSGADVNSRNDQGNTPLHTAAMYGMSERVFILVNYGADITLKNKSGETAFITAAVAYIELLKQSSVGNNTCSDSNLERFEEFLITLVHVGYVPNPTERFVLEQSHVIDEQVLSELLYDTPRSLKDECIFKIRKLLGTRLPSAIDALPVPTRLKYFINLNHLQKLDDVSTREC